MALWATSQLHLELVGRFYVCHHDGPFTFNDGEVAATQWVPLAELADFVTNQEVPPDSELVVVSLARGPSKQGTPEQGNQASNP